MTNQETPSEGTSPSISPSDLQRRVQLLGSTCSTLALSVRAVLLGGAAGCAWISLLPEHTCLSEHRLARHARPPAALAPAMIHVVPIVSGQHRWWCPGDCHLWNTRGGWTFFCRLSYGSKFLVFCRHGYHLVVLIPANLWDVKSISAFIQPQVSARHESQYMNGLSHPARPHTPNPLTICQVLPLGPFSTADMRRSSEWPPVSHTCTNYPSPWAEVLSLLFPTDTFPHNFTLLFLHFPLVSAKKNLFSFKCFLNFSLECLRVTLPLLIPFLADPGCKSIPLLLATHWVNSTFCSYCSGFGNGELSHLFCWEKEKNWRLEVFLTCPNMCTMTHLPELLHVWLPPEELHCFGNTVVNWPYTRRELLGAT